jgi:hypothetical protein
MEGSRARRSSALTRLDLTKQGISVAQWIRQTQLATVEPEHGVFRSLKLEVEPTERVSEHVHVRQQPGREIGGLVRPDLANVEPLDPADARVHGALAYGDSVDSAEPSVIRVDRGRQSPTAHRALTGAQEQRGWVLQLAAPRALVSVKREDLGKPVEHHDPDRDADDRQADQVGDEHPHSGCPPAD